MSYKKLSLIWADHVHRYPNSNIVKLEWKKSPTDRKNTYVIESHTKKDMKTLNIILESLYCEWKDMMEVDGTVSQNTIAKVLWKTFLYSVDMVCLNPHFL